MLVVDDHVDIREPFEEMLNETGCQCDALPNAEDTLKRLSSTRYDALLLGIYMSGKNGFVVAQELRSGASMNDAIRIIGVSAYALELAELHHQQICNAYFTKLPYEKLRSTLNQFITA